MRLNRLTRQLMKFSVAQNVTKFFLSLVQPTTVINLFFSHVNYFSVLWKLWTINVIETFSQTWIIWRKVVSGETLVLTLWFLIRRIKWTQTRFKLPQHLLRGRQRQPCWYPEDKALLKISSAKYSCRRLHSLSPYLGDRHGCLHVELRNHIWREMVWQWRDVAAAAKKNPPGK